MSNTQRTDEQKYCEKCEPFKGKSCRNKSFYNCDCPCHTPHTPSSEIGEQTDFSETNTTAIAFLQKCLENGHRLRIDDIEITEYKQERVVSLRPSPAFIHTQIENARRERDEMRSLAQRMLWGWACTVGRLRAHNESSGDSEEKEMHKLEQLLINLTNKES